MANITFKNVVKTYDNGVTVIPDLNLEIHDKEFVVLVGPSGCGKSTTLRMIAGLEEVSQGELYIGDKVVNNVPPKSRDIAMVFQSYALYPHMTVYKNMAFALELRKEPRCVRQHGFWNWNLIWTASPRHFPAASGSVLHWDAPWFEIRRYFCWMNRCPTWMPS